MTTNILVAVANSRDNQHEMARDLLEGIPDRLLVPPTVIAEVCYLLSERAGAAAEVEFLRSFEAGELELAELTLPDVRRMAELSEHVQLVVRPASHDHGPQQVRTWSANDLN